MLVRTAVMWKLDGSLRIWFQDGALTQLLAGGLSSLSWDLSIEILEFPKDMAPGLPQKEQSNRDPGGKHNVFLWPNLGNDV